MVAMGFKSQGGIKRADGIRCLFLLLCATRAGEYCCIACVEKIFDKLQLFL